MGLKNQITLWSPALGDILFSSAQAGAIGASFGNGAATFGTNSANPLQMGEGGALNVQIVSAGRNPASTGADVVVAVFSLPANALDIANRGLEIVAQGSLVNNANNKRVKMIFNATTAVLGSAVTGGTTVADTGTVTTIGGGWSLQANVFKYGAAGSNTQIAIHQQSQVGATVSALLSPSLVTAVESAPILIAITANAGTTATDITFNFMQIEGSN